MFVLFNGEHYLFHWLSASYSNNKDEVILNKKPHTNIKAR